MNETCLEIDLVSTHSFQFFDFSFLSDQVFVDFKQSLGQIKIVLWANLDWYDSGTLRSAPPAYDLLCNLYSVAGRGVVPSNIMRGILVPKRSRLKNSTVVSFIIEARKYLEAILLTNI
jgi:hypothetical protein